MQAWVGLLAGPYRLSQRNIVTLLSDAFGVELSVGTVSPLQQQVSAALAAPVTEAGAYVRRQPGGGRLGSVLGSPLRTTPPAPSAWRLNGYPVGAAWPQDS